jgi:hypothetical protein
VNGVVASIEYNLDPDYISGFPSYSFISAQSVHGLWAGRARLLVPVRTVDDEDPDYRFGSIAGASTNATLSLIYTSAAPYDRITRALELDLTCYWDLSGCNSVRQVVPQLWQDLKDAEEAAAARLRSSNPCPDRILAGRVRYLLDMNVSLLEVANEANGPAYKISEVIHHYEKGRPVEIPQAVLPGAHPGDRFLYFDAAKFDSCQIVPDTPSAEAAVRSAVPAPRRPRTTPPGD